MITFTVHARNKIIEPADKVINPLYNGFTIQADLASVATSTLGNSEKFSYEAGLQVDLKHKYYPIVELGFAGANKTTADNISFVTNAPFARVGMDFNLLKKKEGSKPTNNMFLAGLRLGMSNFNYEITNISIANDYWGGKEIINYSNIPAGTKMWWEIVAGVRVEIIRNIYMGWTVRTKSLLSKNIPGEVSPWYIPGFGLNSGSNWGFNYTIGYHF